MNEEQVMQLRQYLAIIDGAVSDALGGGRQLDDALCEVGNAVDKAKEILNGR